jgi:PTS system glucitol/sorbitol-specific IIA component
MIKYDARVTAIGPLVAEFLQNQMLVMFREGAPEELAEFSILHDGRELRAPVVAGDEVILGEEHFRVLAVGEVANSNLAALGHLILKFNGETTPEMPGDVCLEARPLPEVPVGLRLQIAGAPE